MKIIRILGALVLPVVVACGDDSDYAVEVDPVTDPMTAEQRSAAADPGAQIATTSKNITANNVTITGRVMYNDRRNTGKFSWRRDLSGRVGRECGTDGRRDDGTICSTNSLGLYHAIVEAYERDTGYFSPTAWNCRASEKVGTALIGRDGRFTLNLNIDDRCSSDSWNRPAIALRVRLRYCNAERYCFSVALSEGREYALYHGRASYNNPLLVRGGESHDVGTMTFRLGASTSVAEDYGIAANYFADLVDAVLVLHRDNSIPFYYNRYGEVEVVYPSSATSSGTTRSASLVVVADRTTWPTGGLIPHEYGHVVHLRAWDDDAYGWNGIGRAWNGSQIQSARLAFKEGWAQFIKRIILDGQEGCNDNYDANDSTGQALRGTAGQGERWVPNVAKTLCDWRDTTNDDDPNLRGSGDHFTASLYSTWYNLRKMWTDSSRYGGSRSAGLDLCDYFTYYLDVRKSAAQVGTSTHRAYERTIADLAYQNHASCGLPVPAGF